MIFWTNCKLCIRTYRTNYIRPNRLTRRLPTEDADQKRPSRLGTRFRYQLNTSRVSDPLRN